MAIVKYGAYTPEAAEADAKAAQRVGNFLKLAPGKHRLRFLPPPVGKKSIFKKVNQHFIEVNGQKIAFVCPRYEAKLKCPGCLEVDRLLKSGNAADREYAKEIRASERFFANVINKAEPEKGVQVMQVPWGIHQALTALAKDTDAGGDFTNPEHGFDILVTRTGTGKNDTRYQVFPDRKSTPLAPSAEEMQSLIDSQPDLDILGSLKSFEELVQAMAGQEEDAAAKAKPAGSGSSSGQPRQQRSQRRSAQDDIEDAEVAEDD